MQGRYGQGVQICKLERAVKLVGSLGGKKTQSGLVHFRQAAARSIRVDEVELSKRLRSGLAAFELKPTDMVEEITPLVDGLAYWNKPAVQPAPKKRTAVKKESQPALAMPEAPQKAKKPTGKPKNTPVTKNRVAAKVKTQPALEMPVELSKSDKTAAVSTKAAASSSRGAVKTKTSPALESLETVPKLDDLPTESEKKPVPRPRDAAKTKTQSSPDKPVPLKPTSKSIVKKRGSTKSDG